MESSNKYENINEIESLVRNLNKAWIEKRIEDLYPFFHKDVVAFYPEVLKKLQVKIQW
jgi:hypothetical protein